MKNQIVSKRNEIQEWIENNRKRLLLIDSYEKTAIIIAKNLYAFKEPNSAQIKFIVDRIRCQCINCTSNKFPSKPTSHLYFVRTGLREIAYNGHG